jgi:hypothetical protein
MTNATYTATNTVLYENDNCSKPGDHFALLLFTGDVTSFLKSKSLGFIKDIRSSFFSALQ